MSPSISIAFVRTSLLQQARFWGDRKPLKPAEGYRMSSEAEGGIDCLRIERRRGGAQDGMPRRLGKPWPDVMLRLLETFSGAPLVSHYFARYGNVYSTPPSEQVRGLFERWSIKFSADYYEAKDRQEGGSGPRLG
jgi:hypothetical protein